MFVDAAAVWFATDNGTVQKCATTGRGGQPTVVFTGPKGASIASVDATNVYFTVATAYDKKDVMRCPLTGCCGSPTLLVRGLPEITGWAVDATSVYWSMFGDKGTVVKLTPK